MSDADRPVRVGVVGVGSMGRNHARVYRELADAELVGVADMDSAAADRVAGEYGTESFDTDDLLSAVDAVSIAVPTSAHAPVLERCIDAGVHALVEKPFVDDLAVGRELARRAAAEGVTVQVGHVERFNPAVRTLMRILPDLDVVAVDARRLGPPVDRELDGSVVSDLMIHDIDVVNAVVDARPGTLGATGAADGDYATVQCVYDDDTVATFTASRVTRRKVRELEITARECLVAVDYLSQSVEIHRGDHPEYIESNGTIRHRTESVIERPFVETGEPLKGELAAFVDAVADGDEPVVTPKDGLDAVEFARQIEGILGLGSTPSAEREVHR
ncbi:Gfo/Idh/MocA family oxidoreductase (plasmid) [Halobaculum sp. CBA1158]|uniref:Gfo/Idh/MocA family protein n=1 Tax=Halobaculum sp. CBA1158 TaxID=2904243 RepID=UPI001F3A0088|nr:Gfo/Idh/MocA family oxidoreductase [Halobaculum sp. CBA1158]UIP01525.1 Gfo/Idh/MocA family oxidoreductase [Halobaculum sp. CBA1158]